MTQPTSQLMADALAAEPCAPEHEARRQEMVQAALQDHYHDMFGEGVCPITELHAHCQLIGLHALAARVRNGEFDATKEESDAWATSPEGAAAFSRLTASPLAARTLPPGQLHDAVQRLAAVVNDVLNGATEDDEWKPGRYAFVLLVGEVHKAPGTRVSIAANVKDSDVAVLLKELSEKMNMPVVAGGLDIMTTEGTE